MSTITKEWLQQKIADMEAARDEIPFGLSDEGDKTLAALRIALASLEAEAVYQVYGNNDDTWSDVDEEEMIRLSSDGEDTRTLYTAPPATVSVPNGRAITQHFDTIALETAREIMCDVNRRHEFLGGEVQLLSRIQCRIDDACRAAMLQGGEHVTTAYKLPEETSSSLQLRNLIRQRHAEWSQATFGDVGPVGPLKHLSKEALEAAEEPDDLSEWSDMQFLLWDAQRRAGISDGEITAAMEEKLKVNMARQWPEPKDGEPRLHIKAEPQQEA